MIRVAVVIVMVSFLSLTSDLLHAQDKQARDSPRTPRESLERIGDAFGDAERALKETWNEALDTPYSERQNQRAFDEREQARREAYLEALITDGQASWGQRLEYRWALVWPYLVAVILVAVMGFGFFQEFAEWRESHDSVPDSPERVNSDHDSLAYRVGAWVAQRRRRPRR